VHPFEASVWAQPRLCAQTDVSPCDPAVHLRAEGGCASTIGLVFDHTLGIGIQLLGHRDRVALVPKSERANRPWVIQKHQAAAIAAIVHNRGREPVWRSISCGLVWPLGRVLDVVIGLALTSWWSSICWSSASSWVAFSHLAVAPDHLGAHPRGDIRCPSRVRWLHLPTDVAGERLAPACRRCRLSRRIHRALLVEVIYPPGLTHGMHAVAG
jgi:hypothetical protein